MTTASLTTATKRSSSGISTMTKEELAKEYVDKLYAEKVSKKDYDKDGRILYRSDDISDAFLSGLEASRPKWHKVADGDLPKHEVNVLVFVNKQCIDIAHYNYDYKEWHFSDSICRDVIAWCEIPQYTEE